MIFALLFIAAFLIGLAVFLLTDKWMLAVAAPVILFCLNLFFDPNANISFNLVFGLPLVAVAGLLACYVVVIRRDDPMAEVESSIRKVTEPREDDEGV